MNWKYLEPKFEYEESFNDSVWPWIGHRYFAYDLIVNIKPKVIVELGTHYGTSLWSFSQAIKDYNLETEINAVDTWKGEKHAGFYGEEVFETVNQIKHKYYKNIKINLIRKTFDEALAGFTDNSIDVLHIDGLHTYDAVKHDFENWLPKLKQDGIIIFHDIKVGEGDFGVYKLWEELKKKYLTIEFFQSYGLGVLLLDKIKWKEIKDFEQKWQMHYSYLHETLKIETIKNNIKSIITAQEDVDSKKREIQLKDDKILNLISINLKKDLEISSKNMDLKSIGVKINRLNFQLQSKIDELSEIQRSKGWRVILILRRIFNYFFPNNSFPRKIIVSFMKGSFGVSKILFRVKKIILSLFNLFKKAILIFKMNGLRATIIRAIKYLLKGKLFGTVKEIKTEIYNVDYIDSLDINLLKEIVLDSNIKPEVSIIIPVYNKWKYTYNCLESLVKNINDISFEVILVDDCSTDDTSVVVRKVKNLIYIKNKENLGFVGSCNNGAKKARGEHVVFLNNDTYVKKGWLSALVNTFKDNKNIGLVGSKLIYPDGRLQEAGGIIWKNRNAWNYGRYQNPNNPEFNYLKDVDYCSGASIILPKKVFDELGGFDTIFSPGYCEDSDLAFRVRGLGFRTVYQPKSELFHFEGVTSGNDLKSGMKKYQIINSEKFFERWSDVLEKENCDDVVDGSFLARDRSKGKKTVLIVDHYAPTFDKDAGSRTVYQYIKLICELGYNVKFIGDNFNYDEKYVIPLEQMGVEVLYSQYYYENWERWIKDNSKYIDLAFVNRPHISGKYIDVLKRLTKAKIIYYGHDLHFLRVEREYELTKNKDLLKESEVWKEVELGLMRKADISLYPSQIEVEKINKIDPKIKVGVLTAYMYDNKEFKYDAKNTKDLLFIGGFGHKPNIDAVLWFCKDIFPKVLIKNPDIKLYIVGSNSNKEILDLNSSNVIVKGFLSDIELSELYRKVRLMVAPLRYGAGIKGKIIESMYQCVPVITTDCGAEGIDNKNKMLIIANDSKKFINDIDSIYPKFDLLNKMSVKGKKFIDENYSIDSAAKKIKKLF